MKTGKRTRSEAPRDSTQEDEVLSFGPDFQFGEAFPDLDEDSRMEELLEGVQRLSRYRNRILNERLSSLFSPEGVVEPSGVRYMTPKWDPSEVALETRRRSDGSIVVRAPGEWHDGLEEPVEDLITLVSAHELIRFNSFDGHSRAVDSRCLILLLLHQKAALLVHIDSRIRALDQFIAAKRFASGALAKLREAPPLLPFEGRISANPDCIKSFVNFAAYLVERGLVQCSIDGFLDHFSFRGKVVRVGKTESQGELGFSTIDQPTVPEKPIQWLGTRRDCIGMMAFLGHEKDDNESDTPYYYLMEDMTEVLRHFVDKRGTPFVAAKSNPERSGIADRVPTEMKRKYEFWINNALFTDALEVFFPFYDTKTRRSPKRLKKPA